MRRVEGLVEISRRRFCGGVATCLGLAMTGCTDGTMTPVETGPLGGTGNPNGPDAGMGSNKGSDASVMHDSGVAATCPASGATDVGAASTFTMNNPVYFSTGNFFVVRDSGGLYALTARCTHNGVTIVVDSGDFFCPAHGATFSYNGDVLGGPTSTSLVHYAMCTMANGHVGVIKSQTVSKSQRLVA